MSVAGRPESEYVPSLCVWVPLTVSQPEPFGTVAETQIPCRGVLAESVTVPSIVAATASCASMPLCTGPFTVSSARTSAVFHVGLSFQNSAAYCGAVGEKFTL